MQPGQPPLSPQMPPAPPPPNPTGFLNGAVGGTLNALGGAGNGGTSQGTVSMDAPAAYNAAIKAVHDASGKEKLAQPPTSISFEVIKKGFVSTGGLSIRYDGILQIAPLSAHQSAIRVQVKTVPGTLTPLFFVGAIVSILMMLIWYAFMSLGAMGLLLGIVVSAAQFYTLGNSAPRELAEKILKDITANEARTMPVPPPTNASATTSSVATAPVPPISPQQPAVEQVATNPIIEQLAQLGKLHDAGVLTPDEFERAKTGLLSRL